MDEPASEGILLPIFAGTDQDLDIYRTIEDLEAYAEAVDVENGEWTGYDASGREIALQVEAGKVRIHTGKTFVPQRLAERLRAAPLLKVRGGPWLSSASLPSLVAAFDEEERARREQLPVPRFWRRLKTLIRR